MRNFFQPLPSLKFTPTGRWDEATRVLGKLNPEIKAAALAAQSEVAKEIIKQVKSHLINQDLSWRPLKKSYRNLKSSLGWDDRILLATHSYLENITMWKRANGWQVFVGVKAGVYGIRPNGKRSKLPIHRIATIHEFGTGRRRRPLWNPTIRQMGNTAGIKALYLRKLRTAFRKGGLGRYITQLKNF